mgnify:FL=1
MRSSDLYPNIFEKYKAAGRELGLKELKRSLPTAGLSRERLIKAVRRTEKMYRNRWHEIYAASTGVVYTPVEEPVKKKEKPAVDPLEALAKARKKREEHE